MIATCIFIFVWLVGSWFLCIEALASDQDCHIILFAFFWPLALLVWLVWAVTETVFRRLFGRNLFG